MQSEFLNDGGDRLISRLKEIKDPREVVELAAWNVLSRAPAEEEHRVLGDYLRKRRRPPRRGLPPGDMGPDDQFRVPVQLLITTRGKSAPPTDCRWARHSCRAR